jgi:hypothetical protein
MHMSLGKEVTVGRTHATVFDMSLVVVSVVAGGAAAILCGVAVWVLRRLNRRFEEDRNVGPYYTDSRAGAYCEITLANGQKVIVSHDKGPGFAGGRLTIEHSKLLGFNTELIFRCDLDSAEEGGPRTHFTGRVRHGGTDCAARRVREARQGLRLRARRATRLQRADR